MAFARQRLSEQLHTQKKVCKDRITVGRGGFYVFHLESGTKYLVKISCA
jgi:hypothetical protein